MPGDGSDDPALAWNLWWVPYSIFHLGSSPIYTDYMFYPIGLNLAFYTLTYLNAFLAIPIQFAANLVVAANVNLLLSYVLSGLGAYWLVKYLLRTMTAERPAAELAAFVAGVLYAFSSNKMLYASLGQFNIASSQWIPFYILSLLKATRTRTEPLARRAWLRYGFLLGLFLLFQALSEFIFASFLIIFTALYLAYRLIVTRFRLITNPQLLFTLLVASVTFIIPMLPILVAMGQDLIAEGDFIQRGLGFADVFSSDVLGFFVPSQLNPAFRDLQAQFHFAYTNFAYLGFAALLLAVLALWKMPQARAWGVWAAVFVLISLGPDLRVNGSAISAPFLPFNWLLEIPLVKGNRYPSRWSVMVTLALAVMVGYGLAWILQKLASRQKAVGGKLLLPGAFSVLLFLILFEHLSVPLPLSNFQIPDIYGVIAQDKGDFSVLEIPLAWRNGFRMTGTIDSEMMFEQWYQTEQNHPILGGNTSRNPEQKFQYFTEAPVLNSLIAVETGHTLDAATQQRDRELAPTVLRFFGVRYVVWHSPLDPQNRRALDAARAYVESVLPVAKISEVSDDMGETVAFRVNELPPLNPNQMLQNAKLSRLSYAEGWGTLGNGMPVWATRRTAGLFVRLDQMSDEVLSLQAFAPMPDQRATVLVNGRAVGTIEMRAGQSEYTLRIERDKWQPGMNRITFEFDKLMPVAAARAEEHLYAIGVTGVSSPVSIVVRSAGSEVGDFAHIFVNGVDAAQNLRGYNIVVVDPQTGAVESSTVFDTFGSAAESTRLAQFVSRIPNGRIVAVAARDTVAGTAAMSQNLTGEAVDALRSLGASEDLRGKFRWSHALIGVKGAQPGIVLEDASETLPAQVVAGIGAMEPNVAAALEGIEIEPR